MFLQFLLTGFSVIPYHRIVKIQSPFPYFFLTAHLPLILQRTVQNLHQLSRRHISLLHNFHNLAKLLLFLLPQKLLFLLPQLPELRLLSRDGRPELFQLFCTCFFLPLGMFLSPFPLQSIDGNMPVACQSPVRLMLFFSAVILNSEMADHDYEYN